MAFVNESTTAQVAFVGRQPIYGRAVNVFAYELLYRNGDGNLANFVDEDGATTKVMLNTFLEIGLDRIVGEHKAFINVTRNFILEKLYQAIPKERVVLEVLEHIQPDPPIIDALTDLSKQGYMIALDDFVYHEALEPLVAIADIVKVDVLSLPRVTVKEHVRALRRYPVKLLAEKVETHEDFEFCKSLGFDFFQGYFFCEPNVISGRGIPTNRMSMLFLLTKLQNPEIQIPQLEDIIKTDVSLSLKILRYVNSAYFGLLKKVDSIAQAACLVGIDRLRTWATLLAMASIKEKPYELIVTAMVRARMCEQLGLCLRQEAADSFFTVGLFSVLDSMFDSDMSEIVNTLPLSSDIRSALLPHEGVMGEALNCVIAYERGNWESVRCRNLELSTIREAYLNALHWTSTVLTLFRE